MRIDAATEKPLHRISVALVLCRLNLSGDSDINTRRGEHAPEIS